MLEIHRAFRAGFAESPNLVRGVRNGDSRHAEVVATQLNLLSAALHAHHGSEDEGLWPRLEARAPACLLHVERMKAQHAEMVMWLEQLDAALPAWRVSGTAREAEPILAALDGVNTALAEHLGDEEKNIVPVMEQVITEAEVKWYAKEGQKSTPKGQMWNMLGMIMAAQPDGGAEFMRRDLPAPVRVLWRLVGQRQYAKTRAELAGHAA